MDEQTKLDLSHGALARAHGFGSMRDVGISTSTPVIDLRSPVTSSHRRVTRVEAVGKHLAIGGEPFRVRGVTYGSFVARADGALYPSPERVWSDVEQMAGLGVNTLRVYTSPTIDLVEAVAANGIRIIVGVDYRDWRYENRPGRAAQRAILDSGRRAIDEALTVCGGRPEVLAVSVGNEVPSDIVRVHGINNVEDVLSELAAHVRQGDPDVLVTYTNFPTTEYLRVEGLTLATYNVFLEDPALLRRYLRHLQMVSGPIPLVVTELGLAGEIHGDDAQAELLAQQLDVVDETGCAGATVFSFTDEWGINGHAVEGWGFGITTADRTPKAAAPVVSRWASRSLDDLRSEWPKLTVIVCAYNEQRTITECLSSLARCEYPDLEVIVCDDGSTDDTLELARRFPFRILELPHGGLSRARNAGIHAAGGELVAFLDADAACHPWWPYHLALAFDNERIVAGGGPNLPFPNGGLVERAVALSPGAPIEVLVGDDRAEHVPGCNMAFRREAITDIGCFDPVYTSAGDDVDVCWKLLDRGGEIAYNPAAQVFHHRRATVKGYLRQQRGYGKAEKLLAPAHRHRFNRLGQAKWAGFIYGGARLLPSILRPIVYHGHQGHAPFQSVTSRPAENAVAMTGAMLPICAPAALAGLITAAAVAPAWIALTVVSIVLVGAYAAAVAISLPVPHDEPQPAKVRALVGALHVAQPFVRTWGRLRGPRRTASESTRPPLRDDRAVWLGDLHRHFGDRGVGVRIGGPHDDWDLEVRGIVSVTKITTALAWRWQQQWRVRSRLRPPVVVALVMAIAATSIDSDRWAVVMAAAVVAVGALDIVRCRSRAFSALGCAQGAPVVQNDPTIAVVADT